MSSQSKPYLRSVICITICESTVYFYNNLWKYCITSKIRCKFFSSLQTLNGVALEELECKHIWSESSNCIIPLPLTLSLNPPPNFQFSHSLAFLSFTRVQFFKSVLPMEDHFTYVAAFKRKVILCAQGIGHLAVGIRYAVSEAYVHHWWSTETKPFLSLTYSL